MLLPFRSSSSKFATKIPSPCTPLIVLFATVRADPFTQKMPPCAVVALVPSMTTLRIVQSLAPSP